MFSVELTKAARKALIKLPRDEQQRIIAKLETLAENPRHDELDVKPMRGKRSWRLRVGQWRVIYDIHDDRRMVQVIRIGSRGEVYG